MPRIARKNFDTSFFHVIVQGIKKEYIFNKKEYIEEYLNLISKYKNDYNIKILAYCIMNNHAHLLVHLENIIEMSNMMHKVNFIYAQKYNKKEERQGYVFRNRFFSEPIYNEKYLLNCINYIHLNPVKANMVESCEEYNYSSYSNEITDKVLKDIFGNCTYSELLALGSDDYIFYDIDIKEKDILKKGLELFKRENELTIDEILNNRVKLKKLIKYLKEKYNIKYTTMSEELGISKGKIDRLK